MMDTILGWYMLAAAAVLLCTVLMICWQQREIARLDARIEVAKQLAVLQAESVRLDAYHYTAETTLRVWDFLRDQGLDVEDAQPTFDLDNAKMSTGRMASKTPNMKTAGEVNHWD